MTTLEKTSIPVYVSGTWTIDTEHSYVGFVVTHALIDKIRGQFETVTGEVVIGEDILDSRVQATINAASFHTNSARQNERVRSADFLDVERYPTLSFASTKIGDDDGLRIEGDLTLHGVTKPVVLHADRPRFGTNQNGVTAVGISAHTTIRRSDFDVTLNAPMPGGGLMLGEDVDVILEIAASLQQ